MRKLSHRAAAAAAALILGLCSVQLAAGNVTAYAADTSSKAVSAPKASVESGYYEVNKYVKLTSSTSGARIFYTLDGSDPTVYDYEYTDLIRIKGEPGQTVYHTILAIAVKTGYEDSEIVEFDYTIELPPELEVTYAELLRAPSKKNYDKGEALDVAGGYLLVTYEDRTYERIPITASMISGFNTNTAGEKTITVTYKGFTDKFTINVSSNEVRPPAATTPEAPAEQQETKPTTSGAAESGWAAVNEAIAKRASGATVTINLNGVMAVPAETIRIAKAKNQILKFKTAEGREWTLNTKDISAVGIPTIGLGIRSSAIYIPKIYINALGGTAAEILHINSSNRLGAALSFDVGTGNINKYASLMRFNTATKEMVLVDTVKIGSSGKINLTPDVSGDYVVIVDSKTKLKGDLDNNARITTADIQLLLKLVLTGKATDSRADVNGDGLVSSADVTELYRQVKK